MPEFTEWAREIIAKADAAARRLNPAARVRLSKAEAARPELRAQMLVGALRTELVDTSQTGDRAIELDGVELYVASDVEGLIDVEEPHDRLVLKPAGSPHTERH